MMLCTGCTHREPLPVLTRSISCQRHVVAHASPLTCVGSCACAGPPFNCGGGPADDPTAQQVSIAWQPMPSASDRLAVSFMATGSPFDRTGVFRS